MLLSLLRNFALSITEKTLRSVGIQCDLNSEGLKTSEKENQRVSLKQESLVMSTHKRSLEQSYYDDDDTLDSTKGGQKIVKVQDVIDRRRLQYKTKRPDDYNSDDPDSKFRNWSLRTPSLEEGTWKQPSWANSLDNQNESSFNFSSSSLAFIQPKDQEDSSATVSDLEFPSPTNFERVDDSPSPVMFSQDFF